MNRFKSSADAYSLLCVIGKTKKDGQHSSFLFFAVLGIYKRPDQWYIYVMRQMRNPGTG